MFIHLNILYLQNVYYQSPRNPNLIAIVPVDEHSSQTQLSSTIEKVNPCLESCSEGKFILIFLHRNVMLIINNINVFLF